MLMMQKYLISGFEVYQACMSMLLKWLWCLEIFCQRQWEMCYPMILKQGTKEKEKEKKHDQRTGCFFNSFSDVYM